LKRDVFLIGLMSMVSKREKFTETLKKRYPNVYSFLKEKIERNECPFCGEKFSAKWSLARHLFTRHVEDLKMLSKMLREKADEREIFERIFLPLMVEES